MRFAIHEEHRGGNAGESNPPETFLTPHIGFEDRGLHQHAKHFRGQYVYFGTNWQAAISQESGQASRDSAELS